MYMGVSDWDIDAMVYSAAVCLVGVVSMPLAWRCSAPSMESTSRNVAAVGCSMHGAWSMVGKCAALNVRVRLCDDALVAGTRWSEESLLSRESGGTVASTAHSSDALR